MKKLSYLIVLTLILGLVLTGCLLSNVGQVPSSEQSGISYLTKGTSGTITLYAGQNIDVGTVSVWNDGVELHVTYNTTGGWVMTETHLAVADSLVGIPHTKKGNPIPGKFPYKHEDLGYITSDPYIITLSEIDGGVGADDILYIAAHAKVIRPIENCWETVWQIGDVEGDDGTGYLTNYCDEFNYAGFYEGIGPLDPPFTDPFVVDATPTNEFPWLSLTSYASDFKIQWSGELQFGGKLTVSWSPGQTGMETKIITSIDDGVPFIFVESGSYDPAGWLGYPLVQSNLELNPIGGGTHEIHFQQTTGNGAIWDWVLLEKPCEQEETAWAGEEPGVEPFSGKNWATYFTYTVQGWWDLTGTYVWRFLYTGSPAGTTSTSIPYDHDMDVTIHEWYTTGDFIGEGGYPAEGPPYSVTWVMTGNVDGDDVEFYIDYDESGYYIDATGTIASDGSMSGTCETVQGSPYEWLTTLGFATRRP